MNARFRSISAGRSSEVQTAGFRVMQSPGLPLRFQTASGQGCHSHITDLEHLLAYASKCG